MIGAVMAAAAMAAVVIGTIAVKKNYIIYFMK